MQAQRKLMNCELNRPRLPDILGAATTLTANDFLKEIQQCCHELNLHEEEIKAVLEVHATLAERLMCMGFRIQFGNLGVFQLVPKEGASPRLVQFTPYQGHALMLYNIMQTVDDPMTWYRFKQAYENRQSLEGRPREKVETKAVLSKQLEQNKPIKNNEKRKRRKRGITKQEQELREQDEFYAAIASRAEQEGFLKKPRATRKKKVKRKLTPCQRAKISRKTSKTVRKRTAAEKLAKALATIKAENQRKSKKDHVSETTQMTLF